MIERALISLKTNGKADMLSLQERKQIATWLRRTATFLATPRKRISNKWIATLWVSSK